MHFKERSEANKRPTRDKNDTKKRKIRLRNQITRIEKDWANASKDKKRRPGDIMLNKAGDQIKVEDTIDPTDIKPIVSLPQLELDPTANSQSEEYDLSEEDRPRENVVTDVVKLEEDYDQVVGEYQSFGELDVKQDEVVEDGNLIYNTRDTIGPVSDPPILCSTLLSSSDKKTLGFDETQLSEAVLSRNLPLDKTQKRPKDAKITSSNTCHVIKSHKKLTAIPCETELVSSSTATPKTVTKTGNGNRRTSCLFCNKLVRNGQNLEFHIQSHIHERHFQCQTCFKTFSSPYNLKGHTQSHAGSKPFPCSKCSLSYLRKGALKRHVDNIHEKNSREYKLFDSCIFCGKNFFQRKNFERHIRSHTAEKPYTCHRCSKDFGRHSDLNRHLRIVHHRVCPFKCEVCKRAFSRKDGLQQHQLRMHGQQTKTRRSKVVLSCLFCERIYFGCYNLELHMRSHTKEKPISCKLCSQSFVRPRDLTEHIQSVHEHKTPFKCEVCGKAFGKKSSMKRHAMRKHVPA